MLTSQSSDETASVTSADKSGAALPLSRPGVVPKPRLKSVWRSPVWDFFSICDDKKYAKCAECSEVVLCGGGSSKMFTTLSLVSHLRASHPLVYQRFSKAKDKKES